jgi:ABC-type antimicrobial peptide transport system permease subunit
MPLPTRRAIRQQLYRRGGGRGAGALKLSLMLLGLIGLVISALFATFSARHHAWVMPLLYVSAATVVISVIITLLTKG